MTTQSDTETEIDTDLETEIPDRFVGFGPAADYLGFKRNTLSSYSARGIGPKVVGHEPVDQYNMPVFLKTDLDEWKINRPGQGARTDLSSAA